MLRVVVGCALTHITLSAGKIADMYTKLNASRAYVYAVAKACDQGKVSRRVCVFDYLIKRSAESNALR